MAALLSGNSDQMRHLMHLEVVKGGDGEVRGKEKRMPCGGNGKREMGGTTVAPVQERMTVCTFTLEAME